jgi:hypothetical protein
VYHGGQHGEEALLRSAYLNSMKRALENDCISIAFPLISSGIYGYLKDEAFQVATSAIQDFLVDHDLDVTLVIFDKATFAVSEELLGAIESYMDEHYIDEEDFAIHQSKRRTSLQSKQEFLCEAPAPMSIRAMQKAARLKPRVPEIGLDDLIGNLDESFSNTLMRLIDAKGKTDVEIYKRANIDRKLFSKIRTGKGYMPSKKTAIALAVALELSLNETDDLLERAGYALSHSQKFDVIVEYFIISGKYDIFQINEVLFKYDQQLLGGV